jgi:hypothetical protein
VGTAFASGRAVATTAPLPSPRAPENTNGRLRRRVDLARTCESSNTQALGLRFRAVLIDDGIQKLCPREGLKRRRTEMFLPSGNLRYSSSTLSSNGRKIRGCKHLKFCLHSVSSVASH